MKTIIDSTDKKHIGEQIDETQDIVVFADGGVMQVTTRLYDNQILANSNYVIFLSEE